jgi:hypothetical protein
MSEETPRFELPFIIPGQAQKELFHNEALTAIDLLLQAAVEGPVPTIPPALASPGQCWIVGLLATEAWTGKQNQLAMWTEAGWRFAVPATGMSVWDKAAGHARRWDGAAWSTGELDCSALRVDGQQVIGARHSAIASPSGGTIIDAEARAAVAIIIATLMSHGLIY